MPIDLSIIIVNWNTRDLLVECLDSIYSYPPDAGFDIWVVDNASNDGSPEAVREAFPQVNLIQNQDNAGFGRANNQAAAQAAGRYLLLLNPDTAIHSGALNSLIQYLEGQPEVGAVGPRLLNTDGSPQVSAFPAPTLTRETWRLFHLDRLSPRSSYPRAFFSTRKTQEVDTLMGACILLRREVIDRIGLFDEQFFVYSEEVDLCLRIRRAGWQVHWLPTAQVTHFCAQSTRQVADEMFLELYHNKVKFFRKHQGEMTARFYKALLYFASATRYLGGQVLIPWRPEWRDKSRQYQQLIRNLRRL